jgi:hypothetical protein
VSIATIREAPAKRAIVCVEPDAAGAEDDDRVAGASL